MHLLKTQHGEFYWLRCLIALLYFLSCLSLFFINHDLLMTFCFFYLVQAAYRWKSWELFTTEILTPVHRACYEIISYY